MIIKSIDAIPSFLAGDETKIKEILHPKNDKIAMAYSLAHASLEVGTASLPHTLKESEVYFILQGEATVHIDGQKAAAKQGDTIYIPAKAEQYVVNEGSVPLQFLCIVSPAWSEEGEDIL